MDFLPQIVTISVFIIFVIVLLIKYQANLVPETSLRGKTLLMEYSFKLSDIKTSLRAALDSVEIVDLLLKMIHFSPSKRPSAKEVVSLLGASWSRAIDQILGRLCDVIEA